MCSNLNSIQKSCSNFRLSNNLAIPSVIVFCYFYVQTFTIRFTLQKRYLVTTHHAPLHCSILATILSCFQFKVHTTILMLTTPSIDWSKTPTPLTGLPDDVLQTILQYMYAECLPRGLTEETVHNCVKYAAKIPELTDFITLCNTFLQNTALKQRMYFHSFKSINLRFFIFYSVCLLFRQQLSSYFGFCYSYITR